MILAFATESLFRQALLGGFLPDAVRTGAVKAQFSPEGEIRFEAFKKDFSKKELDRLSALDVTVEAKFPAGEVVELPHIWMLLSLELQANQVQLAENAPVLFEFDDEAEALLTPEMLRLGNDRIGYHPERTPEGTMLLRVIGPPYYTFLRTLESDFHPSPQLRGRGVGGEGEDLANLASASPLTPTLSPAKPRAREKVGVCRAYLEAAPRVWVRAGFRFAAADNVVLSPDQFLLAGPPRDYRIILQKPFFDLYERVQFQLPRVGQSVSARPIEGKIAVPLRLIDGDAGETPSFWVFRGDARDRFERWLQSEDERHLARFLFAVGKVRGETVVIVQTRPTRDDPPALPDLGAEEYRPFWKLPNLFVPVGRRLQPLLRRDKVRELLLNGNEEIVWLRDAAGGQFEPESIAEASFRPLDEWVEYILTRESQPLTEWLNTFQFEFDDFICPEEEADTPPPIPPAEMPAKSTVARSPKAAPRPEHDASRVNIEPAHAAPVVKQLIEAPSELRSRREKLEKEFLALDSSIESEERQRLWPALARVNGELGEMAEAALCWTNAAWQRSGLPGEWLEEWASAEARFNASAYANLSDALPPSPGSQEVRLLAVRLLSELRDPRRAELWKPRLPAAMAYLEEHDRHLGIRLVWLLWATLMDAAGLDILRLARVRDRLLERLRLGGLNVERDLPMFLRYGEQREGDRLRAVRFRLEQLRETALAWHGPLRPLNQPYVDLIFAFGMARLGQETTARERFHEAGRALLGREIAAKPVNKKDEVGPFLWKAFAHRIEAAFEHKPTNDLFPESFAAELDAINKRTAKGPFSTERYAIERFLEQSWILSPQGSADPYRMSKTHKQGSIRSELERLAELREKDRLTDRIRRLLNEAAREKNALQYRVIVMADSLVQAPRAGEEFTLELLRQVPALLAEFSAAPAIPDADLQKLAKEKEVLLLQQALYLAGHFNQPAMARELFRLMSLYLNRQKGNELPAATAKLGRGAIRGLRKLGLRDEVQTFLKGVYEQLIPKGDLAKARSQASREWPTMLAALLPLAEAWQALGAPDRSDPILAEARSYLFAPLPSGEALKYTPVAQAYIAALGQAAPGEILLRIDELYAKLAALPNTMTTAPYYSRFHLNILEETVRTLVGDDQAVGPEVRRWLEDDEFLVRQRIHREMQQALSKGI